MAKISKTTREIELMIIARYVCFAVLTFEEDRIIKSIYDVCTSERFNPSISQKLIKIWSCTKGLRKFEERFENEEADEKTKDPIEVLDEIVRDVDSNVVYLLCDFHPYLEDPTVRRKIKDTIQFCEISGRKTIIFISPVFELPIELEKYISIIDFDLPYSEDLKEELNNVITQIVENDKFLEDDRKKIASLQEEDKEKVVKSLQGLTMLEASRVLSRSIVATKTFDCKMMLDEKKQIIRKAGILEYFSTDIDLSQVGGFPILKNWLINRKEAFSDKAREFGLPEPKGILLLGIPGTGKSLCAKAMGNFLTLPLLRFDVGKVFGALVGSSEERVRQVVKTAESIAPCILFIDEIEKGFSGVQSSTFSDSGTTARVFGSFISWMQDKKAPVFVVATANDVSLLPPEFLRKGRFDEIFFMDLPSDQEREEIFKIHFIARKQDYERFDLQRLISLTHDFNGAEIEQSIISGLYIAFAQKIELQQKHVEIAIKEMIPLSTTMKEQIEQLRTWASRRARSASFQTITDREDIKRKISQLEMLESPE